MLRLIEGGFYSERKNGVIRDIKALVDQKKRTFMLVPEQQALTAEKEMVKILPSYAPLCFEVTNFSRFANSAFRALGGVSKEYVDKARRMITMWQTLNVLSPILNMTQNIGEINTGTVDRAVSAVVKMQSSSLAPEDLLSVADDERLLSNKRLKSKLSDLSKIMTLYRKTLVEKYNDVGDDVSLLCALLLENPEYLSGADIFFEGFTSFTEPQYKLIGILMDRANVHVSLNIPKLLSDSPEYTECNLAKKRLKKIAAQLGTEVKLCRLDAPRNDTMPLLREVGELLWQNFSTVNYASYSREQRDALRIFEAPTPYDMCDFIGADIRRRIMDGALFRDFAIIARDAEEYSGIISSALASYDIPVFISQNRDIADFEAIKLINSAYKTIRHNFQAKDVLSYAKCSLCGISREACDEFEEYIHTWQISGNRFYDGVLWNMSPRGLASVTDEDSESLLRINETRENLISPLVDFREESLLARTAKEHAKALFDFLSEIKLQEAIEIQSEELLLVGEEALAEDNRRLWKIICDSLDLIVDSVSDTEITRDGFQNLLEIAFSSAKVGKIPSHFDEVTVGSADMLRLSDKKHVYIIGVNSGEFPKSVKDNSYFNDREKLLLSELGLSLSPENEIQYSKELFSFSRAFSYGSESVTLIYTKAMRDFSKSEKSPVIDRICEICGSELEIKKISALSGLDFIYTRKSALSSLGRLTDFEYKSLKSELLGAEVGSLFEIADTDIESSALSLSEESVNSIYPGDIGLSQSRLDRYNSCPLSYFCSYNLGLDSGERAKFNAKNIGSFIHSVLENFFREVRERGLDIKTLTKEERDTMARRHARAYVMSISDGSMLTSSARLEAMLQRLTKSSMALIDGLCDEFSDCDYVPAYFELDIGKSKTEISPSAVRYTTEGGRNIYVAGIIDRVDTYKSGDDVYVRVVDYKTGQKEFKPSDIDEGENLQMFLYLKAICDTKNEKFRNDIGVLKGGRIIPAGVIYVKTDLSDITIPKPSEELAYSAFLKNQTRKGMLLDDKTSIDAMNKAYIPIRYTKSGEPDSRTKDNLYTEEGWEGLSKKVEHSVLSIFSKMESGDISPAPKKKGKQIPCEYCPYKPICRKESVIKQ